MGVTISQTDPPGPALQLPEAAAPPEFIRTGGGAAWSVLTHERNKATIRWDGTAIHRIALDLLLDDLDAPPGWTWTSDGGDVHDAFELLHRWTLPTAPGAEPPQVKIGWLYGQQLRWVLDGEPDWDTFDFGPDGRIVALRGTVNLLEAAFAEITLTPVEAAAAKPEPARPPGNADGTAGDRTHVVAAGETLTAISIAVYGDASHVAAIVAVNNLPDPDLIVVGQTLTLPAP